MRRPRGFVGPIFARAPARQRALREHEQVRLQGTFGSLPKGSVGTVVGVGAEGELYEVEFLEPIQAAVTMPSTALTPLAHDP